MPVSNPDGVEVPSPVIVFASRFHRAARDGLINVAAEASSKDANFRDEEGLTPTLWAAFCGNIDVLRVFVSRGGIPGKFDRLGNTGLHLAAAGGFAKCVAFLIDMGEDIWALNVDRRTPRDMAANCPDGELALRLLDEAMARETAIDPRKVRAKKKSAKQRADKLIEEFRRFLIKNKKLEDEELRNMLERSQSVFGNDGDSVSQRRHSDASLASSTATGATTGSLWSAVRLQALQRGRRASANSKTSNTSNTSSLYSLSSTQLRTFNFTIGTITDDGNRTARPLHGIAPSTGEVLFATGATSARRSSLMSNGSTVPLESVTDAFDLAQQTRQDALVVVEQRADSDTEEDPNDVHYKSRQQTSMFDRPGFGTMAFRHSLTGLETSPILDIDSDGNIPNSNWSFKNSTISDVPDGATIEERQDEAYGEVHSPLEAFLFSWDLPHLIPQVSFLFKGDLEELLSITEDDDRLESIPMGPRKKLLKVIEIRNETMKSPPSPEDAETKL